MRFAMSVLILFGFISIANAKEGELQFAWVDVEGGAATLIVTPAGETILIDSGNPGRRDPERILKVLAEVKGKRRIDHLITTHYHSDHFGGAATLAELVPIGTVYDNGEFKDMPNQPDPGYKQFKCEKRVVINPGDVLPIKQMAKWPKLEILCLGTRKQFVKPTADSPANEAICGAVREKDRDGSDNANSVVLLLKYGNFRFFDAGDLTWNMETHLVCPKNLVGRVDVYQVTHHGLDASNNPLVIQSLQPTVAIMNNGTTKGTAPEVLAALKEQKSVQAIYQMHKNLRPNEEHNNAPAEYIANATEDCKAEPLFLDVSEDGASYTVTVPATGHKHQYDCVKK